MADTKGWFPRFNQSNGALIWEDAGVARFRPEWLDGSRTIWHNETNIVIDGVDTGIASGNDLTAGGGKWYTGFPAQELIVSSVGERFQGMLPAISPDGQHFAYVQNGHTDNKTLLIDGRAVASGPIGELRLGNAFAVWTAAWQVWVYFYGALGAEQPRLPFQCFNPVPAGPFVLAGTHTGFVISNALGQGYRFDNNGEAYFPDVYWDRAANVLRVAYSDHTGTKAESRFSLADSMIDLTVPVTAPPPPPIPAPVPAPIPIPKPEPTVPTIPDSEIARAKAEIDRSPIFPNENDFPWVVGVALRLGGNWGLNGKRGDASNPSHDILAYKVDSGQPILVDVLIDGGGQNGRTFNILPYPEPAGAVWLDPRPFGVPVEPPVPSPSQDPKTAAQISEIFGDIDELRGLIQIQANRITELNKAVEDLINRPLRHVKVSTSRTLGHTHKVEFDI